MNDDTPIGKRFSQVYLDRGEAQRDSPRFRVRLLSVMDAMDLLLSDPFLAYFRSETGSYGPPTSYKSNWKAYILESAELRDLLDIPTVAISFFRAWGQDNKADSFRKVLHRILLEEAMGYRIDERGGLHPFVDTEFERTRVASIAGLGSPKYGAALAHFEAAYTALDGASPDTRTAIRETFDALETVFKLMLPVSRLGAAEVKK